MKYRVHMTEDICTTVIVEAANEDEAKEMAIDHGVEPATCTIEAYEVRDRTFVLETIEGT